MSVLNLTGIARAPEWRVSMERKRGMNAVQNARQKAVYVIAPSADDAMKTAAKKKSTYPSRSAESHAKAKYEKHESDSEKARMASRVRRRSFQRSRPAAASINPIVNQTCITYNVLNVWYWTSIPASAASAVTMVRTAETGRTGKTATPQQAQDVHALIRKRVAEGDAKVAQSLQILYGGSVKPGNAQELFVMPDIDGGLIGGASLKAPDFLQIVAAAH